MLPPNMQAILMSAAIFRTGRLIAGRHGRSLCSSAVPSPTVIGSDVQPIGTGAGDKSNGANQEYDIIINGGGIVGFSLLAALSKSPFLREKRILLLEQQPKKSAPPPSATTTNRERQLSNRVSSLTIAAKNFYEDIGIWQDIQALTKQARAMHVWSTDYNQGITFTPQYPGMLDRLLDKRGPGRTDNSTVCYFLENHVLLNALERLVSSDTVRYSTNVTDVTAIGSRVKLTIGDGAETITTKLLVGCDGFNSLVRRKSTLRYYEQKLNEKGIVGTVQMLQEFDTDQNDVTYQRFLPEDGTVIGLLPLTETCSSFVISTSNERADQLMQLSDEEFVDTFNHMLIGDSKAPPNPINTIANTLDDIANSVLKSAGFRPGRPPRPYVPQIVSVVPKSRAPFPLGFATTVPSMVGSPKGSDNKKIVIIGDSAHRVQPLAGQGLNLGIGDAIELAECLEEPLQRGADSFTGREDGDEELRKSLNAFERNRLFKLIPMLATIASMQTLFVHTPSVLVNVGNSLGMIKNEMVKFANAR